MADDGDSVKGGLQMGDGRRHGIPRSWEKIVSGAAIVVLILPVGLLAESGIRAGEQMFREMDLGRMPLLWESVAFLARRGLYQPVNVLVVSAAVLVVHFLWAGRSYRRLFWFDVAVIWVATGFYWASLFAFLQPLSVVMERIGR